MVSRKKISTDTEKDIFIKSRRRCCICFGLNRDEIIKKGQIAHLDQNRNNNKFENLAFLCLDHHDQYDGKTSQSKNLTKAEVIHYRDELYQHFEKWSFGKTHTSLLNFLASTITDTDIADAAIKAGHEVTCFPEYALHEALTCKETSHTDWDISWPLMYVLDRFSSWGILTYEFEEIETEGLPTQKFKIEHEPVCARIAKIVAEKLSKTAPT